MKSKTRPTDRATAETFSTLGLKWPTHHFEEVRAAYRRRCHETHPDKGGDAAAFRAVREAWALLDTPEKVAAAADAIYGFEPVDAETARRVVSTPPDPAFSAPPHNGPRRADEAFAIPEVGPWEVPDGSACYPTYRIRFAGFGTGGIELPTLWETPDGRHVSGPSPEAILKVRPGFRYTTVCTVEAL